MSIGVSPVNYSDSDSVSLIDFFMAFFKFIFLIAMI